MLFFGFGKKEKRGAGKNASAGKKRARGAESSRGGAAAVGAARSSKRARGEKESRERSDGVCVFCGERVPANEGTELPGIGFVCDVCLEFELEDEDD